MKKIMPASCHRAFTVRTPLKFFPAAIVIILISMLYSSLSFAGSGLRRDFPSRGILGTGATAVAVSPVKSIYDSLHLDSAGLSREAFELASKGWEKLAVQGRILNSSLIAIVDFSQPSSRKRLYVLDMKNYTMPFNTLVAHGRSLGAKWAFSFSNEPSSFKSSPGFYITGDTYTGSNGYSLKLSGVEKGINDNAFERAIVMHGADYVNPSYIDARGYIGRSLGCPAVPRQEADSIINTIRNGACLFIYTPDRQYASRSVLLTDSISWRV